MKVYITKYCFTEGILEKETDDKPTDSMIVVRGSGHPQYFHKNDWHADMDSAKKKAEDMRKRRLLSLAKQIQKLEQLSF